MFARGLMFQGCRVLDLFCGDGFYAYRFYAEVASHVDAIDRDPRAIQHAERHWSDPRIVHHLGDVVRAPLPKPPST